MTRGAKPRVRVVFGEPSREDATVEEIRQDIRKLGDWIRNNDATAGTAH